MGGALRSPVVVNKRAELLSQPPSNPRTRDGRGPVIDHTSRSASGSWREMAFWFLLPTTYYVRPLPLLLLLLHVDTRSRGSRRSSAQRERERVPALFGHLSDFDFTLFASVLTESIPSRKEQTNPHFFLFLLLSLPLLSCYFFNFSSISLCPPAANPPAVASSPATRTREHSIFFLLDRPLQTQKPDQVPTYPYKSAQEPLLRLPLQQQKPHTPWRHRRPRAASSRAP